MEWQLEISFVGGFFIPLFSQFYIPSLLLICRLLFFDSFSLRSVFWCIFVFFVSPLFLPLCPPLRFSDLSSILRSSLPFCPPPLISRLPLLLILHLPRLLVARHSKIRHARRNSIENLFRKKRIQIQSIIIISQTQLVFSGHNSIFFFTER